MAWIISRFSSKSILLITRLTSTEVGEGEGVRRWPLGGAGGLILQLCRYKSAIFAALQLVRSMNEIKSCYASSIASNFIPNQESPRANNPLFL